MLLIIFVGWVPSYGQLIVGEGFSAQVLVGNVLVGDGVQTRNISYTGHNRAIALFENGDDAELGLDKGIIISSGIAAESKGPNNTLDNTKDLGYPGDQTLDKIAGLLTGDAGVLQFDFKPQTEEIEFKYIFTCFYTDCHISLSILSVTTSRNPNKSIYGTNTPNSSNNISEICFAFFKL